MLLLIMLGKTPLTTFFLGTHGPLGAVLFVLVALRLGWLSQNSAHRPQPEASSSGNLASVGHRLLYVLMIVVPVLALLRSYGSGRAFTPFGISLWEASDQKIDWMVAAGNAAHGVLAWVLLVMIAGHIAFAVWHRVVKHDQVWGRMV